MTYSLKGEAVENAFTKATKVRKRAAGFTLIEMLIAVAIMGILTLVAYQFVAAGDLPRVAYLTVMDALILWSFVTIGSTLITNVINMRKFRAAQQDGLQADRMGRRYFPLVYIGGFVALVIVVAFLR